MSEESLTAAHDDFLRAVEITRDARFAAEKRLRKRQRSSAYVVSFLSLYVIALSLIPNVLELDRYQNQILLACSIVLSVFVIFASLIDGSENFYHNADLPHACARKVATINHDLKNVDTHGDQASERERFERLQERYERALADCPINHDAIDRLDVVVAKPHLFPKEYAVRFPAMRRWLLGWRLACGRSSWAVIPFCAVASVTIVVLAYVIVGSKVVAPAGETKGSAATQANAPRGS